MTISYQLSVANASFAGFPKLLGKWKGSVYKLMIKEFMLYAVLYTCISVLYRYALEEEQRRTFERMCIHIEETINHVPLTFVLGFYVSFVVSRWWEQLISYPWPDRMLYLVIFYFNGTDERSRMYRRTLARYLQASTVLLIRTLSVPAKKRFPSLDHMVEAGLLTKEELQNMNSVKLQYGKFWVPLVWFTQILDQARREGAVNDPTGTGVKQIMDELLVIRSQCGKMFIYDWVSIPISYTQVVTLATYSYFFGCLFSRQFLDPVQSYKGHSFDVMIPVFSILQFIFYVGWLKVAETLINPWGEDDDDFEVNWFVDRHTQAGFAVVDDMQRQIPALVKDKYWGQTEVQMPHTLASANDDNKKDGADFADLGSTMDYTVPLKKQRMSISGPANTSRRASSVASGIGSIISVEPSIQSRKLSRQWEPLPSFSLPFRRKSSLVGSFKETFWSLPDKDNMRTILESPTSERDNLFPSESSTSHASESLHTTNVSQATFSRGADRASSTISEDSEVSDASAVPGWGREPPLWLPYIDKDMDRKRAWQSRKDTRDSDSSSRNIQASPERKAAQTKTSLHLLRKSAPEDAPVADLKRL